MSDVYAMQQKETLSTSCFFSTEGVFYKKGEAREKVARKDEESAENRGGSAILRPAPVGSGQMQRGRRVKKEGGGELMRREGRRVMNE